MFSWRFTLFQHIFRKKISPLYRRQDLEIFHAIGFADAPNLTRHILASTDVIRSTFRLSIDPQASYKIPEQLQSRRIFTSNLAARAPRRPFIIYRRL